MINITPMVVAASIASQNLLEEQRKTDERRRKEEERRQRERKSHLNKSKSNLVITIRNTGEPQNPGPIVIGTGKTKRLIKPAIVQQASVDEVCEKIAQNLTDTIEMEW